jgi:hypothetical protein
MGPTRLFHVTGFDNGRRTATTPKLLLRRSLSPLNGLKSERLLAHDVN